MHELSIAAAIVSEAVKALQAHKGARVEKITISLGRMSGVDKDALEAAFPLAAEETELADTKLVIESIPLVTKCRQCGKQKKHRPPFFLTCKCGNTDVEIISGKELYIKSMELDVPDSN